MSLSEKLKNYLQNLSKKEDAYLKKLIQNKTILFIKKADGETLENLTLIDFNIGGPRHMLFDQEGQKIIIAKLDCVFLAKLKDKTNILKKCRKDAKNLPRRMCIKTTKPQLPSTKTLKKIREGFGGLFFLSDGFSYLGFICWFTRWNILLSIAKGSEIFIFKHACKRWFRHDPNKNKKHKICEAVALPNASQSLASERVLVESVSDDKFQK